MVRGAEQFTDDSVVSDFQDKLTEAQRSHIQLRSVGGDYLVERYFPAPHHIEAGILPFDHPTAVSHMSAAQEHFTMLRNLDGPGLEIPETRFKDIVQPEGTVVIQGIHKFVEATPFGDYWNWAAYGNRAPFQHQAAELAQSLVKYFVEVENKHLNMCLDDIAGVHQWGVTPDGRAVLLDSDPLMCDLEPEKRPYTIGNHLRSVQAWARLIQPAESGDEMMETIEEVIQSNGFGI